MIDYLNLENRSLQVLGQKDPELSYMFAKRNPTIHFKEHQDIVAYSKNLKYIFDFAKYIPNADIALLQNQYLKSCEPLDAIRFAKEIPKSNKTQIQQFLIDSKDAMACTRFAIEISDADTYLLQKNVMKSGDLEACQLFLHEVKGISIHSIKDKIAELKKEAVIKELAEKFSKNNDDVER